MIRPAVFEMIRRNDETGVSGTGKVGEGFVASNGKVTFHWITPGKPMSVVSYDAFADFEAIHITPHPSNKTVIRWLLGGPER